MVKHVMISSDVLVNHLSERCLHYHYCLTRSCPEEREEDRSNCEVWGKGLGKWEWFSTACTYVHIERSNAL